MQWMLSWKYLSTEPCVIVIPAPVSCPLFWEGGPEIADAVQGPAVFHIPPDELRGIFSV